MSRSNVELADAIREEDFARTVTDLANQMGYAHMHVRRTVGRGRRWTTGTSVKGWPDFAFWREQRFFLAELKSETGKLSPDQTNIIRSLRQAGVDVYVWRPSDWEQVVETFTAHRQATGRG